MTDKERIKIYEEALKYIASPVSTWGPVTRAHHAEKLAKESLRIAKGETK